MAASYKDIQGAVITAGTVKAKPGKADEVAQWFSNIKKRADSDEEPGTLLYYIVRSGDLFSVWEKYVDAKAVEDHVGSMVKEFQSLDLFEVVIVGYYAADSLPPPTAS